jgi:uncharacterized protein YfaS (alpha-2-macroglobulin family)
VLGAEMKEVYNEQLVFGEINPDITFNSSKGLYLGSKGKKNIGISIVNIPKVKITIAKIYANNLLPFLKSGTSSEYSYDDGHYSEYSVFDFENYGDVIYEKLVATKLLKKSGSNSLLNFDFTDKLKDKNGIYVLTVQSENEYWISASKIISLTDIGLIVKEGKQKTMVFANSIQTATPLSNLKIQLISTNNQLIDEVQTDSKGVATFIKKDSTFPNYKMGLIVAETKGDYNFLYPNNDEVTTSRFEVGGKYLNSNYDAFIYSERSVYRPGETVHLSGIVRNRKWQVPGDLPITLKFMLPNGKEYKSIKKIINEEGSFESDINIPVGMITGTYTADVYTADNILLGSKSISIEEFMPDRIKLTTSVSTPE